MNWLRSLATAGAVALALALAACAGGTPPVTERSETVGYYCLESRAQQEGHLHACDIAPSARVCAPKPLSDARAAFNAAQNFCVTNPPTNAANLDKIKGFVAQQQAAAR